MIPSDAALVLYLLALGVCTLGLGAITALGGPSRLSIALEILALIFGLLVLILLFPVVFA